MGQRRSELREGLDLSRAALVCPPFSPEQRGDRAPVVLSSEISSCPVSFFILSIYSGANQELYRARRVLHFTEQEVFWECRAAAPSFRSETYSRGSPLRRDFLGQTKLQLGDTSAGSISDNPYLMLAWDAALPGLLSAQAHIPD